MLSLLCSCLAASEAGAALAVPLAAWLSRDARDWFARRRSPDALRERLEVLHDSGEMELVAGAGEAA